MMIAASVTRPGYHDVGPRCESFGDAPPAQVSVDGHRVGPDGVEWRARVEVRGLPAVPTRRIELFAGVVTIHDRHPNRATEPSGDRRNALRARVRVESACVGDDLDAPVQTIAEHIVELIDKRCGVSGVRVLGAVFGQHAHGQFGQPVAGENIDRAAVEHFAGRGQPIAEEAAAVGDS